MSLAEHQPKSQEPQTQPQPQQPSNRIMAMENVKVAVRLRPFTERERVRSSRRIVDMEQNTVLLQNPKSSHSLDHKKFTFDYSYWSHDGFKRDQTGVNVPDPDHPNGPKYVGQAQVFSDLGKFLIDNALAGYDSALLAYGQTGSGKSYTVSGYGANEGILPRFARGLFAELDKRVADDKAFAAMTNYEVHFSMIEIYNEVVRDLLAKQAGQSGQNGHDELANGSRRGLKVREHPSRGFFVESLSSFECKNQDEIERRINDGQLNKSIAYTRMNETSSRGHTIYEFRIRQMVESSPEAPKAKQQVTTTSSTVQLVDLAGSERMAVHVTGQPSNDMQAASMGVDAHQSPSTNSSSVAGRGSKNQVNSSASTVASLSRARQRNASTKQPAATNKQRFKESVSINQSLSALGNCIQVLSQASSMAQKEPSQETSKAASKIPYRDSVLTKLINKCCLSGNSRVVIIATLSPVESNFDDTLSTLRFADRAKRIRTHAQVNVTMDTPEAASSPADNLGELKRSIKRSRSTSRRIGQPSDDEQGTRLTNSNSKTLGHHLRASSQTSNFDHTESAMENFTGSRIGKRQPGSHNIDSIATPTRRQQKPAGANRVGGASIRRKQPSSVAAKPHPKPSKANTSIIRKSVGSNESPVGQPDGSGDDLDAYEELESTEGVMSPESDDSVAALADDDLSNEEKIEIFNRILNNSIATDRLRAEARDNQELDSARSDATNAAGATTTQTANNSKLSRPNLKQVSVISSSLKKSNPFLSSLNQDEQLTGVISYIIKPGESVVGKDTDCDIVLNGPEVRGKHARIIRSAVSDELASSVSIEPIKRAIDTSTDTNDLPALMLNGIQVSERTQLHHCDRLLFGTNSYFAFANQHDRASANGPTANTVADLDMVTFEMARAEVLRNMMNTGQNRDVINEINGYTHRPGTGKQKNRVGDRTVSNAHKLMRSMTVSENDGTETTTTRAEIHTQPNSEPQISKTSRGSDTEAAKPRPKLEGSSSGAAEQNQGDSDDAKYRNQLMDDTYEYVIPVAEVNAIAAEMGIKVNYGLRILTGEEQLPLSMEPFDSSLSDAYSSSSVSANDLRSSSSPSGEAPQQSQQQQHHLETLGDDDVTMVSKLDGLDVPPSLYIRVKLEQFDMDFYWSTAKFQARRYRMLELYGAWDYGGKSGLVEHLIEQSRVQQGYLIDPFVDDPGSTFVLIGHAQVSLQPIGHLTDQSQSYDLMNLNDDIVGSIQVEAVPCYEQPMPMPNDPSRVTYKPYEQLDLKKSFVDEPSKLLGKRLVFQLKITSCRSVPLKYANVFCQYSLNPSNHLVRSRMLREDHQGDRPESPQPEFTDNKDNVLDFEHSHFICFEKLTEEMIDFLEFGFLTIQVVGQYRQSISSVSSSQANSAKSGGENSGGGGGGGGTSQASGSANSHTGQSNANGKPTTVVSAIINSINRYKYKMEQQAAFNRRTGNNDNTNSAGDRVTNTSGGWSNYEDYNYAPSSQSDSMKSQREVGSSSRAANSQSGANSVLSATGTVNMFNDDDIEGRPDSVNGLSQENFIDMILTKRKLDRAENQLHYLKRTVNIAEHYNKKHIPVKVVKKLLNSYGQEVDATSIEEPAQQEVEHPQEILDPEPVIEQSQEKTTKKNCSIQ